MWTALSLDQRGRKSEVCRIPSTLYSICRFHQLCSVCCYGHLLDHSAHSTLESECAFDNL